MESYEVSNGERTVTVQGTLTDRGRVDMVVDGEKHTYTRRDGFVDEGVCSLTFQADDGTRIEEGPATQEITLADGTHIESQPATEKVRFPDGTVIESDVDVELTGPGIRISFSSEGSVQKQSTSTDTEGSSVTVNQTSESNSEKDSQVEASESEAPDEGDDEEDIVTLLGYATFFGAWFVGYLTGLFGLLGALLFALAVYYGLRVIGRLVTAAFNEWSDDGEQSSEETDEERLEREIAELQEEFLAEDGDIEDIHEYEERIGDVFDGTEYDESEIEIETLTR